MRVIRFLRQFNTVAASILLVMGIAAILAIMLLREIGGAAPIGSGSGSYSSSGGGEDDAVDFDRLNENGKEGAYLLYYRGNKYGGAMRDLVLVEAATGRNLKLPGDSDRKIASYKTVRDLGLLLEVEEPVANDDDELRRFTISFVRFSDFRESTIAEGTGGMDYATALTGGSFSLVARGAGQERTRLIVFDSDSGRITSSVELPLTFSDSVDRSTDAAAEAAADDAAQAIDDMEI